jgi:hypothetical protein
LALIATGSTSVGGLTALAMNTLRRSAGTKPSQPSRKGDTHDVNQHDQQSENCFAR